MFYKKSQFSSTYKNYVDIPMSIRVEISEFSCVYLWIDSGLQFIECGLDKDELNEEEIYRDHFGKKVG